ncbi:MerR family transcriptional regulator [Acrocarpospora catenulata]|uniref:MerR family transcriptional regulator n=1 Tax=Acrocarpospora catenulata TaxID=2836182 RepID=UPI001BDB2809|nr:MerR family transcriptional regulator [Acrocarpospora catenulata]
MADEDSSPSYGIGAVARRLGVPAPTLRTWNLRYGIGPSSRSPGGHRRYGALDLRRLEEMSRLIKAGVPPAEAAQAALRIRSLPVEPQAGTPGGRGGEEESAVPAPTADREAGAETAAQAGREAGAETAVPAGRGVGEGPAHPAFLAEIPPASRERSVEREAGRLGRAAMALDSWTVSEIVAWGLSRFGVAETWDRLVRPVFAAISRRQAATGVGVDVEHLFTERLMTAFGALIGRPARPIHPRPVLLACAEDEQHSLPIFALAAALAAEHAVEVRVLGARTPYSALADAMRRLGPALVVVWSQRAETGDPEPLTRLPVLRPPSPLLTGGPGWYGVPPTITHLTSMNEAISRILAALR